MARRRRRFDKLRGMSETTTNSESAPISGLVAMIHVADVARSAGFYRLLGFDPDGYTLMIAQSTADTP